MTLATGQAVNVRFGAEQRLGKDIGQLVFADPGRATDQQSMGQAPLGTALL
jgi:hypothetical protein